MRIKELYENLDHPLECIRRGLIFNKRIFDIEILIDYTLGFLDFLNIFYTKCNYFGDVNVILRIKGLQQDWIEPISGNRFRQTRVVPIEKTINTELIQSNRFAIVKEMYTSIFNGFGLMGKDLNQFYSNLQEKLNGYY